MSWISWLLALLCAGLTAALWWSLERMWAHESAVTPPAPSALPEGWQKLDELLSMLLALQEHGVSHSGAVSREDFAKAVLNSACQLMKCGRGSVMLYDESAGCLKIITAKGSGSADNQKLFLKPGEGVAGKAFQTAQAIFIADPQRDPRYVKGGAGDFQPFISLPSQARITMS